MLKRILLKVARNLSYGYLVVAAILLVWWTVIWWMNPELTTQQLIQLHWTLLLKIIAAAFLGWLFSLIAND